MISYLLLIVPSILAFLSLAKDWKAHSSHWRRGLFLAAIIASLIFGIVNTRSTNRQREAEKTTLNNKIDALNGQMHENQVQLSTSQKQNQQANEAINKKELLIEGLARTVVSQNEALKTSVMGDGKALVVPSSMPLSGSNYLRFVVYSYANTNLYEVHFQITEAVYPNDSEAETARKLTAIQECSIPTLFPHIPQISNCSMTIPPQGVRFSIRLTDKRGPLLNEEYTIMPKDGGKFDSVRALYTPDGKQIDESSVTGQKHSKATQGNGIGAIAFRPGK